MSLLEVTGLQKISKGRRGGASVEALRNVNFTAEKGEYAAVRQRSSTFLPRWTSRLPERSSLTE